MTRLRDQQLLTYAASRVWATDAATRQLLVGILGRHFQGVRLSRDELDEIKAARGARPSRAADGSGVAVVPLWGVLVPHAGMMVDVSTEGTGLDAWRQTFQAAVADPDVGTILLQVNSPGGSVEGVTETARMIREARAEKRVVAVADAYAASAAFCLASQADTLIVTPSGQVGAVHCYMVHEDISAMLETQGVKPTLIAEPDGGENELMSFLALTDDTRAHLQTTVRTYYDLFVNDVAQGRGVDAGLVESSFGRGRVMPAQAALRAGMVDGISSFEDVLARLLDGKKPARAIGGAKTQVEIEEIVFGRAAARQELREQIASISPTAIAAAAALLRGGSELSAAVKADVTATTRPASAAPATDERSTIMEPVSIDGKPPTLEELAAQQDALDERLKELDQQAAGRIFTADEQAEYDDLNAKHELIGKTIEQIKQRHSDLERRAKARAHTAIPGDGGVTLEQSREHGPFGPFTTNAGAGRGALPDNLFDIHAYRRYAPGSLEQLNAKLRDGALFANEKTQYVAKNVDQSRKFVEALLAGESVALSPHETFATRFLVTANPEYEKQFEQWLRVPDAGRPKMAVSIGGLGSETPIPVTIDPTVLLDSDGATNPLRRLARVVTITGNTWRGIATEGVTFAYEGELAAVTPQTPDFRAPEVTVEKAQAEVQFSIEVDQDWGAFRAELARLFADAKNVKEADSFLHGTGGNTKQPEGLIYALDVENSSVVATATANTLAIGDIRGLDGELPPRFEESAQWLANKAFYTKANELSRAESDFDVWVPIAQGFNTSQEGRLRYTLLGSPTNSASEVSKLFTTGGENVSVLGDFQRGFVIVDRVGMNVELDPLVRDTNGKLIGARALYIYFRNASKLLSANAFRMLQIKAT